MGQGKTGGVKAVKENLENSSLNKGQFKVVFASPRVNDGVKAKAIIQDY